MSINMDPEGQHAEGRQKSVHYAAFTDIFAFSLHATERLKILHRTIQDLLFISAEKIRCFHLFYFKISSYVRGFIRFTLKTENLVDFE